MPFVYVLEDNKAVKKNIMVGLYYSDYITVKDGITASDKVIYIWSSEMYDGAEVILAGETDALQSEESGTTGENASSSTKRSKE